MQANMEASANSQNLPESIIIEGVSRFADVSTAGNLRGVSKSLRENINFDELQSIVYILDLSEYAPEKLPQFIKAFRLTKGYNRLKEINKYDPENPAPFILRVLLEENLCSLPIQEIEGLLKQEGSPLPQLSQNDWNRLRKSIEITSEGIKCRNSIEDPRQQSKQVKKLLQKIKTFRDLDKSYMKSVADKKAGTYINLSGITIPILFQTEAYKFINVSFQNAKLQGGKFGLTETEEVKGQNSRFSFNFGMQSNNLNSVNIRQDLPDLNDNTKPVTPDYRGVDFSKADLQGALFQNFNSERMNFQEAHLNSVIFNRIGLEDASFIDARGLDSCQFKNCMFKKVLWINFENINSEELKIQLDSLQRMWAAHLPEDRARLTKTILSDFQSGVEKIKDQNLKDELLQCAQLPVLGFKEQKSVPFFDRIRNALFEKNRQENNPSFNKK